eukprot:Seg1234.10 transcript_id=Seg1234.10/GoldUCD/mRNA.D3Y31 product="Tudor domain-containing protein 1" protein_id=Seg1234.10/GoldUCD/D3Y31
MASAQGGIPHKETEEDLKFSTDYTPVELTQWDPMSDAYRQKAFNNYIRPNFDADFKAQYQVPEGSPIVHQSVSPTKGDSGEVKLYIGNIPLAITKEGLRTFFSRVAVPTSVVILSSRDLHRGTTFGFVTVSSAQQAEALIREFHNYSFGGKDNLRVKLAKTDEEREREREKQREEEEYYEKLFKDTTSPFDINSDSGLSTGVEDERKTKEKPAQNDEKVQPPRGKMEGQLMNGKLCIACYKEGSKLCSRCKACYCSADCQRSHWPKHQKDCMSANPPAQKSTPLSNGNSMKSQGKDMFEINEADLMLSVEDGEKDDGKTLYNIDEIRAQETLPDEARIIFYVVEDLVMKGQALNDNDTIAFVELIERMCEFLGKKPKTVNPAECREGILVLYDHQGEATRAVVTKYNRAKLEADVLAIDYGNKAIVKVSELKLMPKFALDLPRQCRSFVLHGISNVIDATSKETLNAKLADLVSNKVMVCKLKGTKNGIHEVTVKTEKGDVFVNDVIISLYQELESKLAREQSTKKEGKSNTSKIMEQDIPLQPFPKETEFDIIVSEVISPSCFFGQILTEDKANIIAMFNMSQLLQELPDSTIQSNFKPIVGEACLAFFPDDQSWSRGSIKHINQDGTLKVKFIDYGNVADIDPCFIRPISKEYAQLPRQARAFSHFGIKSSSPDGKWSHEAIVLFREMAGSEDFGHVNCISVDNDACAVEFYLPEKKCYPYKLLLEKGYAVPIDVATNGQDTQPQASTETKAASCIKQKPRVPFVLPAEQIKVSGKHRVIPVHVENPHHFYVQCAEPENLQTLNDYASFLDGAKAVPYSDPIVDDTCCALFTDGIWYRARVVSVSDASCEVFFSDYGNTSVVAMENLRAIPDEVKSLPGQAIRIKLQSVEPVGKTWAERATELMSGNIAFQICVLNVSSVNGDFPVGNLEREEDGVNIAEKLIAAGVARLPESPQKVVVESKSEAKSIPTREASKVPANVVSSLPFALPSEQLTAGQEHRVVPIYVENPYSFFVQVADHDKAVTITKYAELLNNTTVIPYNNPVEGDSCCALFEDGVWYRAKVVAVKGSECSVFFYDYGNTSTVANKNLRAMPDEVKTLPGQAIRTQLKDIKPVGTSWLPKAKEVMEANLLYQLCSLSVSKVENGAVFGNLVRENDGFNIAKALFESNVAKPTESRKEPSPEVAKNEKTVEERPEIKPAKPAAKELIKTVPREPFMLPTEQVKKSGEHRVVPVYFQSPHQFYVQIADPVKVETVSKFAEFLNNSQVIPYDNPIPDDSCCALFEDGVWYRAKVVSVCSSGCKVFFLDYGNTSTVTRQNLRVMPEEVKSLPGQAIQVRLSDIEPIGETWMDKGKEMMEANLSFQLCILNVSKVEGQLVVGSVVREADGFVMADELVKGKVAKDLKRESLEKQTIVSETESIAEQVVTPIAQVLEEQTVVPQEEPVEKQIAVPMQEPIKNQNVIPEEKPVESIKTVLKQDEAPKESAEKDTNAAANAVQQQSAPKENPVELEAKPVDELSEEQPKVVDASTTEVSEEPPPLADNGVVEEKILEQAVEKTISVKSKKGKKAKKMSQSDNDVDAEEEKASFSKPKFTKKKDVQNQENWQGNSNEQKVAFRGNSRGRGRGFARGRGGQAGYPMPHPLMDKNIPDYANPTSPNFMPPPPFPFFPPYMFPPNPYMFPQHPFSNFPGNEEDNDNNQWEGADSFGNRGRGRGFGGRGRGRGRGRGFYPNFSAQSWNGEGKTDSRDAGDDVPSDWNFSGRGRGRGRGRGFYPNSGPQFWNNGPQSWNGEGKMANGDVSDHVPSESKENENFRGRGNGLGFGNRARGSAFNRGFNHSPYNGNHTQHDARSPESQNSAKTEQRGGYRGGSVRSRGAFVPRGSTRGRGAAVSNFVNGVQNPPFKRRTRLPQEKLPPTVYSGAEIDCIVASIESPSRFYIKVDMQKQSPTLDKSVYEDGDKLETIEAGMLCGAKSAIGDSYYRAVIESVYSEEKILVRGADTGRTEIVDKCNLRRLIPEDFKRSFAVIRCTLYNILPKFKQWSPEATRYFTYKLDMAGHKVKAVVRGEIPSGLMINLKDPANEATFIGTDMVKQGLANALQVGQKIIPTDATSPGHM